MSDGESDDDNSDDDGEWEPDPGTVVSLVSLNVDQMRIVGTMVVLVFS